jgi:hypothetical protein
MEGQKKKRRTNRKGVLHEARLRLLRGQRLGEFPGGNGQFKIGDCPREGKTSRRIQGTATSTDFVSFVAEHAVEPGDLEYTFDERAHVHNPKPVAAGLLVGEDAQTEEGG